MPVARLVGVCPKHLAHAVMAAVERDNARQGARLLQAVGDLRGGDAVALDAVDDAISQRLHGLSPRPIQHNKSRPAGSGVGGQSDKSTLSSRSMRSASADA